MSIKKLLTLAFATLSIALTAQESTVTKTVKLYGYVGNDFFYNSRQNTESTDGIVMLLPKPVSLNSEGTDANASAQAEMLSINTRLGLDINNGPILGATSFGKIEADFAGTASTFFLLRIRHAYMKLNWAKTELVVGQTWHPMFGSVAPTTPSTNGGAPFQPFNRDPQVRVKQNLTKDLSVTAAALYQMQYISQGPNGASNSYLKNSGIPDMFIGLENKNKYWITGAGFDIKTIKPTVETITSKSAIAYAQFADKKLCVKGKATYGQNMTDHLMIGGYGISGSTGNTIKNPTYTNLNTMSGWLNITYGSKVQGCLLLGVSQNLGSSETLLADTNGKYTLYGYGIYNDTQTLVDRLIRVSPNVSYNLQNMVVALEYDWTTATYGKMKDSGRVSDSYNVSNHRILLSMKYIF